ncbi:aminotransferase class I/II-fold pyridoxal phosphate-dependent enzyme [candidate division KSB1 bacterium]|nr:aminotransferase class I/II-fold pyridoxal phosphate-dependent enzyme [candidate division KSB1 bacterium]
MNLDKHVSLNLNVRGLGQSATIAINEISRQLQNQGKQIYRLGLGQSPFPVPLPVVEALQFHAHKKDYLSSKGLTELREAVAEYHRRKDGVNARPEDVLIGPGSKELMFLLQLVYYGELLLPTPCWVSYIPQANIIGRKVVMIPTRFEQRWRITAENLEEICYRQNDRYRPRILILNYPGNPDGNTYSIDELKDLAEVARKYQVVILSDEIYGQLHHKGQHISVAKFYPEGTIISGGLSKWCGAGGWRLGTFLFPPDYHWLLEAMADVASETFTSVSTPIQWAAVRAFRIDTQIERYLCHVRRILAALGNQCYQVLSDAGIKVCPPLGAFYLFPDFSPFREELAKRKITNAATLCKRLLEEIGVAVLPGSDFARPADELTIRIAYVDFDGARALAASETVPLDHPLPEEFVYLWCNRAVEAMHEIVDWLKK